MKADEKAAQQGSLLLVDSNPVRLTLRKAILRDAGFQVIDVLNGAETNGPAGDEWAAAVLLDLSAPHPFEECRRMSATLPVVCISDCGSLEENLPRALESGAVGYLHEPVTPDLLQATLRVAANRAGARHLIADAIPQVVFRTDADGKPTFLNQWTLDRLGITRQEMPALNWLDLIHSEDREAVSAEWVEALQSGTPIEKEYRLRNSDGEYRWHLNRTVPVRDGAGKVEGWIGFATDIHESKLIEQELRESQHFTAAMLDAAPWMVYVYDLREHRNIYVSAHSESILGYPVEEYRAMGSGFLLRLMHTDDHQLLDVLGARLAAAADNEVIESEYRLRNAAGQWRWMHGRDTVFKRDERGQPVLVLGVVLDITESKSKQQQLERDEETQRFLADLSARLSRNPVPEALLTEAAESVGRFLGASRCTFNEVDLPADRVTIYGDYHLDRASLAGVYPISIFGRAAVEELKQGRTVVIEDARTDPRSAAAYEVAHLPLQIDALVMTPLFRQGRWVACLTAGCHHARAWTAAEVYLVETVAERVWLLFENARLLRQTAAALDTARETQRVLEGRTAELVRSNEDLQRFANFISHDLRSPLRSIQAFSQLISARYQEKLGDEGEEWLIFIRNGAERMSRLIDDLLDYSRASNSERAVSLSDCNHLLESALLNLQHAIEESGAVITSEPLPALPVDPQLVRIFQNLIDNAIKYRWAGRVPRIHVSVQNEGNCWRFSVQDNGIGFEMEHAERIFRIFQRLHPEGQFEGTGIGLAVCRQIIERQGGKIWVDSVPGEGSSFHFTVPAPADDLR